MRVIRACTLLAFVLLIILSGGASAADLPAPGAVSGPEGHALMAALGDRLVVLDVRTPEEFAQGHVPGVLLIPVQELEARWREIPEDRPVLIICRTGRRAAAAYDMLLRLRPDAVKTGLWYLKAVPEYKADGTFVCP